MSDTAAQTLTESLTQRRTKWNAAMYARRYAQYLAPLRDEPVKLLEIGIGGYQDPRDGGDSLRAWKRFFPKGRIYGIDIVDKKALEEDGITTLQGSQNDPDFLRAVVERHGPFDVIIDDGSHRCPDVITSFLHLFPALTDEGVYVVEDTHFSYLPDYEDWQRVSDGDEPPQWARYGGSLDPNARRTTVGFFKRLADCVSHQEFFNPGYRPNHLDLHIVGVHFYRNQIFVLKGDNSGPGNFMENNTLRPEWLAAMGVGSVDELGLVFPEIDDPTRTP